MLYAIIGYDVPDSLAKRKLVRGAHLERLRQLQREGRLIIAGPFPRVDAEDLSQGADGSLIVAEFADLASAKQWAGADPYAAEGVFDRVEVRPYIRVFPE